MGPNQPTNRWPAWIRHGTDGKPVLDLVVRKSHVRCWLRSAASILKHGYIQICKNRFIVGGIDYFGNWRGWWHRLELKIYCSTLTVVMLLRSANPWVQGEDQGPASNPLASASAKKANITTKSVKKAYVQHLRDDYASLERGKRWQFVELTRYISFFAQQTHESEDNKKNSSCCKHQELWSIIFSQFDGNLYYGALLRNQPTGTNYEKSWSNVMAKKNQEAFNQPIFTCICIYFYEQGSRRAWTGWQRSAKRSRRRRGWETTVPRRPGGGEIVRMFFFFFCNPHWTKVKPLLIFLY